MKISAKINILLILFLFTIFIYSDDQAFAVPTGTGGNTVDLGSDNGDDFNVDSGKFVVEGDTGNVGVGDSSPASMFTVGSGDLFQVNSSGDLVKIDNVTYNWPGSQGAASTVLTNNGSGVLSWAAPSTTVALSSLTAATSTNSIDSLNFAQTWDWSTTTTETPLTLSALSLTTGTLLSLIGGPSMSANSEVINVFMSNSTDGNGIHITAGGSYAGSGLLKLTVGSLTTGSGISVTGGAAMALGSELIDLNMNNATAGNGINIINSAGAYTGTGLLNLSADAVTTGTVASINSASSALTTGGLLNITASGNPAASWTGDLAKFEITGNDADIDGSALKVGVTSSSTAGSASTALNVTSAGPSGAYVFRANDDGTYTDSTPVVIDVSGNVGVGTASPAVKLHAFTSGSSNFITTETDAGASNASIRFINGDRSWTAGVRGDLTDGFGIADVTAGGLTRMYIDTAGNVGVGDSSPASLLTVGSGDLFQVDSSGNIVKINNVTTSFPASQGAASTVLTNDGSGNLTWTAAGAGDITAVGDVTSGAAFTATAGADGNSLFFEGSTSNGNEVQLTAADPGSDVTLTLPAATGNLTYSVGALTAGSVVFQGSAGDLDEDNSNLFWNDSNDNLGIGTASPNSGTKLQLQADDATRGDFGQLTITGTTNTRGVTMGFDTTALIGWIYARDTAASNLPLVLQPDQGNVGIGDTTPAALFTVGNNDRFQVTSAGAIQTGSAGQDGSLTIFSEDGATDHSTTFQPGVQTQNITYTLPVDDGTASQVLTTNGSGVLSWTTIAGSSPTFQDVYDNGAGPDTTILLDTGTNGGIILDGTSLTGGAALTLDQSGGATPLVITNTGAANSLEVTHADNTTNVFDFSADATLGGSDDLVMDETGRIGIGDTDPDVMLDILAASGSADIVLTSTDAGNADVSLGFALAEGTNTFTMGVDDSDSDKFKISTTALGTNDRLIIDSSGNVGIGTSSPAIFVDILGSLDTMRLANVATDATAKHGRILGRHFTNAEEDVMGLQITSNASSENVLFVGGGSATQNAITRFSLYTGATQTTLTGTERLTVISSGNVGINDTSPDGLFDIDSSATTGIALGMTNTGVYTGTGLVNVVADSATTGTIAALTGNGLTTGTGLALSSSSTAITSAGLISGTMSGAPAASWTGSLAKFEITGNDADIDGSALKVGVTTSSTAGSASTALNLTSAGPSGAYVFRANDDGTYTDSTPVIIDDAGKVGIGSTSAATMLDVVAATGETTAVATTGNSVGNFQAFVSDGTPESVITGSRGDLATDITSNPAVLYFKQSGDATTTGWQVASVGGNQANNYAFIYHDSATSQTLSATDTWTDIIFNTNGQIDAGWTHTGSNAAITCNQTGKYIVSFVITTTKSGGAPFVAVRAVFNGTEVSGSYSSRDIASNNAPTPITVTFILNATAGQDLKFQFAATTTSVTIIQPPQVASATIRPQATVTIVPVE